MKVGVDEGIEESGPLANRSKRRLFTALKLRKGEARKKAKKVKKLEKEVKELE